MNCIALNMHGDENDYENTRICAARRNPKVNLDAVKLHLNEGHYENEDSELKDDVDVIELETKEGEYEQIKCVTRQSDDRNLNGETKGKTIQWKDQPREIKIIIYILFLMVIILYVTVIIAVVIISLPKGEADGTWTHWTTWSNCGVTCGDGLQTRIRQCTNPTKLNGQPDCSGDSIDTRHCNNNPCSADGIWTRWSIWSNCDVTCDNGTQTRYRLCYNPSVSTEKFDCNGSSTESIQCLQYPCSGGGSWAYWSAWSSCDVTCGDGTQRRMRMCYNPSASTEQLNCDGSPTESIKCQQNPCIVEGSWSLWSAWSSCDATCGNGTQTRMRMCYNPSVLNVQPNCEGSSTESIQCQQNPCIDGAWSNWGSWGSCSESCGGGIKVRLRTCTNPTPSPLWKRCDGSSEQVALCNRNACEVDGIWTLWSIWSGCDVTCDNGTQTRYRMCYNPSVSTEQLYCEGNSTESTKCQRTPCTGNGSWTHWSAWSSCDATCGNGTKTRLRMCYSPSVSTEQFICEGSAAESIQCQQNPCSEGDWSDWGSWGSCSESCGGGVKSRLRTCTYPRPSIPDNGCNGSSEQVVLCNKNTCDDKKVSFLAYGSTTLTYSTEIQFPMISFNSGNGFDSSTGRFTCKIPGIYNFAVTLTKQSGNIDYINAYLQINGSTKLQMHSNPGYWNDYGSYPLSVTGNFHLDTNDYVAVSAIPDYFINDYSTSFTGVLVIPDN